MRVFLLIIVLAGLFAGCEKERCAECHIHTASGATIDEVDFCEKEKNFNKLYSEYESKGYDCHERLK